MELNIECENIYSIWDVNPDGVVSLAKSIFNFYLKCGSISEKSCLSNYDCESVSFDFLLCDSQKTHSINKEYRSKDYPADIITFAVFADSDESERFVLDGDINLGEIIIALDKIIEGAREKGISKEAELAFFIAHGILHLLGFDHQTLTDYNFVVESQKKALESINIIYDKI